MTSIESLLSEDARREAAEATDRVAMRDFGRRSTMRGRTFIGSVGCQIVGNVVPPPEPTGIIPQEMVDALRAAGIPANADGSYNLKTVSGVTVRCKGDNQ